MVLISYQNGSKLHMHHPNINFQVVDATDLPFPDETFDLIMMFTVLSSVSKEMGQNDRRGGLDGN